MSKRAENNTLHTDRQMTRTTLKATMQGGHVHRKNSNITGHNIPTPQTRITKNTTRCQVKKSRHQMLQYLPTRHQRRNNDPNGSNKYNHKYTLHRCSVSTASKTIMHKWKCKCGAMQLTVSTVQFGCG